MSQPTSKEVANTMRAIAVLQAKMDDLMDAYRKLRRDRDVLMDKVATFEDVGWERYLVGKYMIARDSEGHVSVLPRDNFVEIPMDEDQPE